MWHFDIVEQLIFFILISPAIIKLIKKDKLFSYNTLFSLAFGIYIVRFVGVVFFPIIWDIPDPNFNPDICLVPFKTMILMWNQGLRAFAIQIIGNIALFFPLGFLLPALFKKVSSFKKIFTIASITSLLVELIQLAMILIVKFNLKTFDVNDIILNITGALLGYGFYIFTYKYILSSHSVNEKAL
ncbi:MAG: VanZ family protein [Clostridiales bacterium]|uniref:VanZ family protein n=1 Tax=Clostridium sp. N3C TaxID=1776758 RepID=UPI00092E0365|nr:VanZ family protein [Clostridium sp. N3C]NLZ49173.1 VanZ family protein [Clostridiales bacterium]SCN25136.1 VanZ like family protein [Clostridium sp. N3C]